MFKAFSFIFTFIVLFVYKISFGNNIEKTKFEFPYKSFSTLDGLPSNETYYTFQDNDGYIWISTDKGVSRFNGYEFENFTTADGLIDNTIFKIEQDHLGRIWFSGYNTKLCYYENYSFHEYEFNDIILSHNEIGFINAIEDFSVDKNNNVFIGFSGYGYIIIDKNGKVIEKKSIESNSYFLNNKPFKFSDGGLIGKKYFNGKYRDYKLKLVKSKNVDFHLALNDTIIKTFNNQTASLYNTQTKQYRNIIDIKDLRTFIVDDSFVLFNLHNLKLQNGLNLPVYKNQYFKIFYINNNFIKVDEFGLWILDADFNEKIKIFSFDKLIIDNYNIISINDIKGNLWINTNLNGVYLIPNYIDPPTVNYHLSSKSIGGIFKKNDTIFFKKELELNSLYINSEQNLVFTNKNDVLDKNNIKDNITFYSKIKAVDSKISIISIAASNKRCFFTDRKDIYELINETNYNLINSNKLNIFSLIIYHDKLLIGTQNGIKTLNTDYEIEDFNLNIDAIDNSRIQDMKIINDYLIIATRGNGLYIIKNKESVHIGLKEGLASNIINQLFVDENNNLWVATNNGANSIKIENLHRININQHINKTHGIISPDIKQIYVDGDIAYLTSDLGLSTIKYKKFVSKNANIPVYFRTFIINDDVITRHKLNDTILQYDDNSVLFTYTGISPLYSKNLIYRYKLIGLEEDWKYTKDRYIRYNSLKPGKYTFIVQARNDKNDWSEIHPEFNFKISRAFYRNPFFIALMVVFILSMSYAFIGYLYWSEKNRNKLQKELNKVKQESLNAQMNPHFVFNSLNSIQSFILKNDKNLANKYLVKFSRLMRITFENSKNQYLNLEDEIAALTLYLDLEKMRFDESFSYEIEIDSEIDKNNCVIPTLLIQPFVENAIWHGIQHKEDGIGFISIKIKKQKNKLIISIQDNGIGINKSIISKNKIEKHESSGIAITKKRLDLVNALEGNNYMCEIINLVNKENISTGTLIKFTIPYITDNNEKN